MPVQVAFRLPDEETRSLFRRALMAQGDTIQSYFERQAIDLADLQRRRESSPPYDFRKARGILSRGEA